MNNTFQELGIREELIIALKTQGIVEPTKIQKLTIPEILAGQDMIGESETGSGKTLAYLLPIFEKVQWDKREMQALVLTPTHELAIQVNNQIKDLAKNSGLPVTSAVIIGNVNVKRQIETIKKGKPHIIVGSPGRILELIKTKVIKATTLKTIVVDEADRLLDQHNLNNIQAIIKTTLKERKLIFFSATIENKTVENAKELMANYKLIRVKGEIKINPDITHFAVVAEKRDKLLTLRKLIHALDADKVNCPPKGTREGGLGQKAIAFLNRTFDIELALEKLEYHGVKVAAIYGEAEKEARKDALQSFRSGKVNLLLASDIAARGLDIKDVEYIISIDMPEDPKDYLHRAGRTGRAGEKGTSISIITEQERELLKKYEKVLGIKIPIKELARGKIR